MREESKEHMGIKKETGLCQSVLQKNIRIGSFLKDNVNIWFKK